MAKKKKTALKPVNRGFATTSVASFKKLAPVEASTDGSDHPDTESHASGSNLNGTGLGTIGETGGGPGVASQLDEFDADKVDEQSLQNLVDSLQEKTEKEIARCVKAIEADRRFSKTLPNLDLQPVLVERIMQLTMDSENTEERRKTIQGLSEDKAIAKLAINYGVLRRLGFSEERVEECLRSSSVGLELEDAYEWLHLHCTEEELAEKRPFEEEPQTPGVPRTPRASQSQNGIPQTPRTPAQFLLPTVSKPNKLVYRLDANAPLFVPTPPSDDPEGVLKARVLASVDRSSSASETGTTSPDPDDPNGEYARLKLQLVQHTTNRRPGDKTTAEFVKALRARLEIVQKSYFFDVQDAEAQYRSGRDKAEAAALQARLRGTDDAPQATPKPKKRPPKLETVPPPPSAPAPASTNDVFGEASTDDGAEGGMFDLLEPMPTTETSDTGTTILIRNMSLPKHWSGRTSKVLLAEAVQKVDRYAAVTYTSLSPSSRAKRASVTLRWEGKSKEVFSMENVACYDDGQAEQFVATLALHALTYPSTEGFAAGASASSGTFFRVLPAVFRDLWDELEGERKIKEDSTNRSVWAKLRTIIEPKMELMVKGGDKSAKPAEVKECAPARSQGPARGPSPEQLIASFRARQATPAYQEMLEQRNTLPIAQYRNEILNSLEDSQVLVLSGETGCGKSTQLPAFILEDQLSRGQHCKIYCTEPRRISAISLAQRVSRELGDGPNDVGTMSSMVGYSIRLESNTSKNTRLAFVTNGIALRMLEGGSGHGGQGTAFDEITHIIIDEVHERTIESDFLLIVLKQLLQVRSDLKVVLMSATVDAEKISNFFGECPVMTVPGRTFPVDVQFLEDAVELTKWKLAENSPYARRQHDKFYNGKARPEWTEETAAADGDDEEVSQTPVKLEKRYSAKTAATINLLDERVIPYDLIIRLLETICFEDKYSTFSAATLVFLPGIGEIRRLNDLLLDHRDFGTNDFKIYPLHSTLSSESQGAVFSLPPPGVRKIVIATNIAETGITIPDITCVIDTGKHREMRFDEKRQISRLVETYVAKSNAAQRRGRAGRVQRGICFHLFTKMRHDTQMADHPLPEMMRLSLSDLALRIKIMKVKLGTSIEDVLSRAMDPPSSLNITRAVSALVEVRALTSTEEITPMGRLLSKLPTDVHLGKFLLIATLFRCLDPALTIAAALNSKSPFMKPFGQEEEANRAHSAFHIENSDFMTLHNAFASWRRASANPSHLRKFCRVNFLSQQNLQQIEELRQQFLGYLIDSSFIQVDPVFTRELSRARYGRNKARLVTVPRELDVNSGNPAILNAALGAGLYPKILVPDTNQLQARTITNNQLVSFHPSSCNFRKQFKDLNCSYMAYFTIMQSRKLYAWETGPVDDVALLLLCGEAEFKLISDTASIDRKVRFRVSPKTNVALKSLRTHLASTLAQQFRGKTLVESQVLWNELAMQVLGKVKVVDEDVETTVLNQP